MEKSLIELAYDFVSKQNGQVSFAKIWDFVKKEANLTDEQVAKKAGQFFTNMMLDGRFVTLGENEWDLRVRQTFDKVHIDMKDVYSDVEASDDDSEDSEEEKEYNEAFNENNADDDASKGTDEGEETSSEENPNEETF